MSRIPKGLCQCGCGERTNPAPYTNTTKGWVTGEPVRFRWGHHARLQAPIKYVVEDHGYKTRCWIWQLSVSHGGYGLTKRPDGRRGMAHKLAWEAEYGPVADGMQLHHECLQRACVRPSHLRVVSVADNCRRKEATKLTVEFAREIRAEADVSQAELARRYGVSRSAIKSVLTGHTWKDA